MVLILIDPSGSIFYFLYFTFNIHYTLFLHCYLFKKKSFLLGSRRRQTFRDSSGNPRPRAEPLTVA